jgi:hypothetical protein
MALSLAFPSAKNKQEEAPDDPARSSSDGKGRTTKQNNDNAIGLEEDTTRQLIFLPGTIPTN